MADRVSCRSCPQGVRGRSAQEPLLMRRHASLRRAEHRGPRLASARQQFPGQPDALGNGRPVTGVESAVEGGGARIGLHRMRASGTSRIREAFVRFRSLSCRDTPGIGCRKPFKGAVPSATDRPLHDPVRRNMDGICETPWISGCNLFIHDRTRIQAFLEEALGESVLAWPIQGRTAELPGVSASWCIRCKECVQSGGDGTVDGKWKGLPKLGRTRSWHRRPHRHHSLTERDRRGSATPPPAWPRALPKRSVAIVLTRCMSVSKSENCYNSFSVVEKATL